MNIAPNVFRISEDGSHYVYAPLASKDYGRFLQVGPDVFDLFDDIEKGNSPKDKTLLRQLSRRNILVKSIENQESLEQKLDFCPSATTLLLTTSCNLRCVYCYSDAGEVPPKNMDFETAKKAIDFISSNTAKSEKEYFDVCFHGGGEPFVAWPLMSKIVSYSQSKADEIRKDVKFTSATNGVLNKKQLEWILSNKINLSLSFDGPRHIHDKQRPMKDGSSSYDLVLETVKFLESNDLTYGIRATITNDSVNRLQDIISFFYETAPSAIGYSLEPLNQCGRCFKTNTSSVDMEMFAKEFINARASLGKDGEKLHYSGARPNTLVLNFCGASGKNFFITPDGYVTSCLEVSDISDPKSLTFFYGKETETGFVFDESKLSKLSSICVENIPNCHGCFAKYSCAGDCPSRSSNNGNVFDTSENPRCVANKKILLDYLKGGLN